MAGTGTAARWVLQTLCLATALSPGRTGERLHVCKESEYHYEYTACDSTGSRWRVAVPHTPGLCTGLPDPVKGTECSFSCKAGEFLDMKAQACKPCAEGTYSLGTGVRFDEWDEVPHGFANVATNLEVDDSFGDAVENCTASTWVPLGDYVASNTDECTATLMYAVNLKQSGTVSFEYIYPDSSIVFEFFVQNDQCQPTVEESRWMRTTEKGWEFHSVELSRGNNVLYWRTTAFSVWSKVPKPVLVRNIGITGVAYTSECFPCKPGTYAPAAGSSACQLCPADTFSSKGATACQPCEPATYAEPGSASCKPRPPCTDKDYFYTHTTCDASGETQLMFKWAEPKICSEELPQAAKLPPSGVKTRCPPATPALPKATAAAASPVPTAPTPTAPAASAARRAPSRRWGWSTSGGTCCPPTWRPPSSAASTSSTRGWQRRGVPRKGGTHSSVGQSLAVSPRCPQPSEPGAGGCGEQGGGQDHLCLRDGLQCQLRALLHGGHQLPHQHPGGDVDGPQGEAILHLHRGEKCHHELHLGLPAHPLPRGGPAIHQRRGQALLCQRHQRAGRGGILLPALRPEPAGSCAPCPPGNAVDRGACRPCPPGTYLRGHPSDGTPTCHPCGPGTHSNQLRSLCYNNCSFSLALPGRILHYDFSALAAGTAFASGPSFTAKGLKYFHHFNISLCGNQGRKMASCSDNVTDARLPAGEGDPARVVTSYVCQSILVPPDVMGYKMAVSSQPVSLADRLVGVTAGSTLDGITSPRSTFPPATPTCPTSSSSTGESGWPGGGDTDRHPAVPPNTDPPPRPPRQVQRRDAALQRGTGHRHPPALRPAAPGRRHPGCAQQMPRGHLRRLHLPLSLGDGRGLSPLLRRPLSPHRQRLPRRRPENHLRLAGAPAVPRRAEFAGAEGEGLQERGFLAEGGNLRRHLRRRPARAALAAYFWKKNQKLEYKYSKLVMNAAAKESELPAPDSCAIMEGEDAEDDLVFATKKSLGKIKSLTSKRTPDGFDSVPLKTSSGSTAMEL
ncbi:unnamed protein product [Bubo scandiacus]